MELEETNRSVSSRSDPCSQSNGSSCAEQTEQEYCSDNNFSEHDANATSTIQTQQTNQGFTIHWKHLDYVINNKWWKFSSNRRPILNDLNGSFKSGQLSAILGPSGAGKSSLLDCLLGLKSSSNMSGSVRVQFNDAQVEQERRKKKPLRIALIPQEDNLLDSLTVTETFMFASKIKNAHLSKDESSGKPFDHHSNVQRVLRQLKLTSCAQNRCSKLSGGQYKRVSIGQELLSRPELMVLDEPTSGLDSVTCFQTIKALRDLIETSPYPLAIVATIHQPDREVFNLFHKAYVLATGGRTVYEGPTECIPEAIRTGIDLVEARRKQPLWKLTASSNQNSADLRELGEQLDSQYSNPARAIVEVAANEYGFEIISALNEMQKATHQLDSGISSSVYHSNLNLSELRNAIANNKTGPTQDSISTNPMSTNPNGVESSFDRSSSLQSLIRTGNGGLGTPSSSNSSLTSSNNNTATNSFDYDQYDPENRRAEHDNLLNLRKVNINQRRSFKTHLRHVYYHMHRSWITIVRDPMLFTLMVVLHVTMPLLISYSFYSTFKADACPSVGPFDVLEEAYRTDGSNILMDLNREIRATFENLGYMFFQIYVIIFAGVCVTSLTYPLVMHVLLKEFRNGWYSMSSYFIGRTLADLPVPTLNVFIAMAISYHLTGQPLSPYSWRFLCVASLTVLATLVAQTQGLMFGALLMNAAQSAVFVAPASTAPLVVVSGFLIRIKSLPWILQMLSYFSFFTHLMNGFIVARYGFGKCGSCDESMFSTTGVPRIPEQARVMLDIWAESYASEYRHEPVMQNATALMTVTVSPPKELHLVEKLVENIANAKSFGYEIDECSQYKPFTMLDFELNDVDLYISFAALGLMLIIFRWFTYMVLSWKIKSSI